MSDARPADKLLHTKLMPPRLHAGVVERDHLLTRLDSGLTKKLTLVSAPTGFGKTTLVGMWIAGREVSSTWVTLDENDNDPTRFWTYVVSALRTLDSSVGKTTLSALTAPQPPAFESLLIPLINDLARLEQPCVLVLEDYHAIHASEVNKGLAFLIQHLPVTLHLVLITRTEPDLPLAILRVRDELVELSVNELRFNQTEAETFLREAVQMEIPSAAVTKLLQQTEGWAAGLRLAALSLQSKNSAADVEQLIRSFSGSDRRVADYLVQEVFKDQPETAQFFLLKTCFFNRLTGALCDAITGENTGATMLEHLERENLFLVQLERSGDQLWYRYNPLFAESIQYLARQRLDEAEVKSLFEKASSWYESRGLLDDAIETALSAKLFSQALRLIEKYIDIHDINGMRTLGRWLESVPEQQTLLHPLICFVYAQIILYTTSDRFSPTVATRLEPFLHAAETAWRAEENHHRLGELFSLRGNVAWWRGNFQKAFEYAHQSLELLPEFDVAWRGTSQLIVSYEALNAGRILQAQDGGLEARAQMGAAQNIHGMLAAAQILSEAAYWQGELEQALQLDQQIMNEAIGGVEMLDDQGFATFGLAQIAYEQSDLARAELMAERTLDLAGQRANEYLRVKAIIQLAYISAAENDFVRVDNLLTLLIAKVQNSALARDVHETRARLSILGGDLSSLKSWLAMISNENQNLLHLQKERETFTLARLQIAESNASAALQALDGWAAETAANGRIRSQVQALCLEALAHHVKSDDAKAMSLMTEALILGHAKNLRRIFLDEGPHMGALLQTILPSLPNRTLNLYATTLLHLFSSVTVPLAGAAKLVEPLSQQEVRVLRLLVNGLSNSDIARELVVSTNTVKTHVKSIYRKLNVNSREDAREVARELRLL